MKLADVFAMELNHEAQGTRRALERVPEDKFDWQPHEKSMTMGRLASHIAEVPGWLPTIIDQDSFDMDPAMSPFIATNRADLLKNFDEGLKQGLESLKKASDEHLMKNWKMVVDGNEMINMPRAAVIRAWVLSHQYHHRGQLTVYLRLNGVPVPSLYGPSADEEG